jgi:catechol 2,3-dioxygenase-like lactoylglutathione lyase family enzyme
MNLNHVTLIVTELQRSIDFYRTLGLVPIVYAPPRYARFVCPQGDATLSIEVTGEAVLAARIQLYFECERPRRPRSALYFAGRNRRDPPWKIDAADLPG